MKQFFNNFEATILAVSLGVTLAISTIFGFAGSSIIGTFWSWFWISNLLQFILFFIINSVLSQRERNIERALEIESLNQLAKFSVRLSCAYCQQQNDAFIQLNQKNMFKCVSCNQTNGIFMQFTATTLTTPLNLPDSKIQINQGE
jgi:hypothetical protein